MHLIVERLFVVYSTAVAELSIWPWGVVIVWKVNTAVIPWVSIGIKTAG